MQAAASGTEVLQEETAREQANGRARAAVGPSRLCRPRRCHEYALR
jgi:hypothetical protein